MRGIVNQQDLFKVIQAAFKTDAVLQGVLLLTYVESESEGAFVYFKACEISRDLFHLSLEVKSSYMGALEKISIEQSIRALFKENAFESEALKWGFKEIQEKSGNGLFYKVKAF